MDSGLPVQYWNVVIPISATPALVAIAMATGTLYFCQPAVAEVVSLSLCLANCQKNSVQIKHVYSIAMKTIPHLTVIPIYKYTLNGTLNRHLCIST